MKIGNNYEKMQLLGKAKIGRLSAKGIDYPQLRLPRKYSWIVGKSADIFATEYEGKQAFLVVTGYSMPNDDAVLKPNEEVLKLIDGVTTESRLLVLESEIRALKTFILNNESLVDNCNEKGAQDEWARPDSDRRPPPCQGSFRKRQYLNRL
jgi:hypothetical protein